LINYNNPDYTLRNSNCESGFFNINYRSTLHMSNSTVSNCRGLVVAFLMVQGGSSFYAKNHTYFTDNYSYDGTIVQLLSTDVVSYD